VKEEQLVLGPFQGPVACTRINKGRGVCGTSWAKAETLIVPDVEKFPGHIACSSLSKSEIVVPLLKDGNVWGVLDVDSELLDLFDETDREFLERIVSLFEYRITNTRTPNNLIVSNNSLIFQHKNRFTSLFIAIRYPVFNQP
jgi:L-methionine (R)-S-oxide reductase